MDRSRSRSAGRAYYRRSNSFSSEPPSRSPSRSSTRRRRHHAARQHVEERKAPSLVSSSIGVLASIGLATYAVHKVWPNHHDFGSKKGDHKDCDHNDDSDDEDYGRRGRRSEPPQRRRGALPPAAGAVAPRKQQMQEHIPDEYDIARAPIRSRSSVHRGRDFVVYEDIVPAREVDPARRREMEANGFERHRRQPDDRRWEEPTFPDERGYRRRAELSSTWETQPRR